MTSPPSQRVSEVGKGSLLNLLGWSNVIRHADRFGACTSKQTNSEVLVTSDIKLNVYAKLSLNIASHCS